MFVRSGILAASILLSVTSCAAPSLEDAQRHVMPLGQTSFAQYAADAKAWSRQPQLRARHGRGQEDGARGRTCRRSTAPSIPTARDPARARLGDSPWSFSDIAQSLAANGSGEDGASARLRHAPAD